MRRSGNDPVKFTIFCRWSDFRVVVGLQKEPTVRCVETIARSGKELGPMHGIPLGSSSLKRASSLLLIRLNLFIPLEDACLSAVWENQEGL